MNKKFSLLMLLTITILVTLTTCRKEKVSDLPCRGYPYEVKEWVYFEPGTYWIYEEENTGIIDCVYVTYATDYNYSKGYDFYMETKNIQDDYYYNYYRSHHQLTENCYPCIKSTSPTCVIIMRDKTKPGDFVSETVSFLFSPVKGNYAYTWNSTSSKVSITNVYSSYTIDSSVFTNVVKVNETINSTENYQKTNFYYSKNLGVIRKELADSNEIWNLIRYNIVQP